MKSTFFPTLFSYLVCFSSQLSLAQDNSQVFSQFLGAPTVTAAFNGPSSVQQAAMFKVCTNYVHGLVGLSDLPASASAQLEQVPAFSRPDPINAAHKRLQLPVLSNLQLEQR
jgi:hypothetical protein